MMEDLRDTLAYSRRREYTGWDLYDGESSRFLRALPFSNKWVNLAFQQAVCRAPVNVRPLMLIDKRRSFKGGALFVLANIDAYELTGEDLFRSEARRLVEWLVQDRCEGYSGYCGGHNHPVQHLDHRSMPDMPGIVGTSYAVRALLRADALFERDYGEIAESAATFLFEDLDYTEREDGAAIKYRPNDPGDTLVLNSNALGARLLLDLYQYGGGECLRRAAEQILDYVATNQADIGGWAYADPPSASHLSMDNFHNGYIVESLAHHRAVTGSSRYAETLDAAADFYRHTLFTDDGAPNYDERRAYPRDIHSVAQGAITFSALGDRSFANRILEWGLENLHAGDGQYYYQKRRIYTKRITLMRWCQAWMAYALSTFLSMRETPNAEQAGRLVSLSRITAAGQRGTP